MKNNFLIFHYIIFINIFLNDIFDEIHIHNNIKNFIKILLIEMIYASIL